MFNKCKKKTFYSKETAEKTLVHILSRGKKDKGNKRFKLKRAYKCPLCGLYHLTSQDPDPNRAKRGKSKKK